MPHLMGRQVRSYVVAFLNIAKAYGTVCGVLAREFRATWLAEARWGASPGLFP
jgi:hypothetical protein